MEEHREGNDVKKNSLKALTKNQQHRSAVIEDSSGNILTLTESTAILNQWTEYCSDLYNSIQTLAYSRATSPEHKRLKACLCSEKRLRRLCASESRTSQEVDNIPSELLQNKGETTTAVLTICQKIWEMKEWSEWTQSFAIPLPWKGYPMQCKKYRAISLISHPSKIML